MDFSQLITVIRNTVNMVTDRGFQQIDLNTEFINTPDSNVFVNKLLRDKVTPKNFQDKLSKLENTATVLNNVYKNGNRLCLTAIFYPIEDNNNTNNNFFMGTVAQLVELFNTYKKSRYTFDVIFICKHQQINNLKSKVFSIENEYNDKNHRERKVIFQYFSYEEKLINPSTHIFNQELRLLSGEEKEDVLLQLKVSEKKLPLRRNDEACVKYFGYKPGDVLEVHRRDYQLDTIFSESLSYLLVV